MEFCVSPWKCVARTAGTLPRAVLGAGGIRLTAGLALFRVTLALPARL